MLRSAAGHRKWIAVRKLVIVAAALLCGSVAGQAEPVELCLKQTLRWGNTSGLTDETEKGVIQFMAKDYMRDCEILYHMLERGRIKSDDYARAMASLTSIGTGSSIFWLSGTPTKSLEENGNDAENM